MKNFLKNLSVLKILCIALVIFLVVEFVSWLPQTGTKATALPTVASTELTPSLNTVDTTSDGWVTVAENGGRQLMVNPVNMNIRVVDTATNIYWESVSNTDESSSTPGGPVSITYIDGAGAEKIWSGYSYSIEDEGESLTGEDIEKKYTVERIPNGFRANMTFASEESTNLEEYMPKMVSVERYNEFFIDKVQELVDNGTISEETQASYNNALDKIYALSDDETHYYNKLAGTPPVSATRILIDLSKKVNYTVDEIRIDSQEFDFTFTVTENPRFIIPVEFTLDNGDLVVNIPTDKIVNESQENEQGEKEYQLKSIHILPNFGIVKSDETDNGFIFVPDGSGAIFDINSYDSGYAEYSRPVYNNTYYDQLYNQSEFRENITMPVFGMGSDADRTVEADKPEESEEAAEGEESAEGEEPAEAEESAETEEPAEEAEAENGETAEDETAEGEAVEGEEAAESDNPAAEVKPYNGFMGIIESGDTTATINVKLAATGDVAADAPYNKVYPSFDVMQVSSVKVFGPYSDNDARFTAMTDQFNMDCRVRYKLYTDNANYYTMSQSYRDYIISAYNLKEKTDEEMTAPRVFLDVISSLTIDARIMGVPYDRTVSMTTYKELAEIYEDLKAVNPIVSYKGAFNGGIYNKVNSDAKLTKSNGGKSDLDALLRDHWDSLYLNVNPSRVYKTSGSFKSKHSLVNFNGEPLVTYEYNIPTGEFNEHGNGYYTVAPRYLPNVVEKFSSAAAEYKNLSIEDLGNLYYEDQRDGNECSPYQGEQVVQNALTTLSQDRKLVLYNPNANRIGYAAVAADVSRESSDYGLIKENVPFRQLVLNGLTDYTTLSVNTASSNTAYFLLQAMELAAFPKYTITAKGVSDLKENNYNELFATEYKLFADDIKEMDQTIKDEFAKIGTTRITSHRVLDDKVYETTYETGVKVITNYNTFDVTVNGETLGAQSYVIKEGGDE